MLDSKNSFLNNNELKNLGLKKIGENVRISRYAQFYTSQEIEIGNNVRIDDFCILSGKILIGNNIHISAFCALYGAKGIILKDYSGLSPRTTIFSAMDDFSGEYMVGPLLSKNVTNITGGLVLINKYVQIGANSIVFPNIEIGEGTVIGSLSLVNKNLHEWGIFAGIPAKYIKPRSKKLLNYLIK